MTSDDGVKSAVKARGRRTTKVKQEFESALTLASSKLIAANVVSATI